MNTCTLRFMEYEYSAEVINWFINKYKRSGKKWDRLWILLQNLTWETLNRDYQLDLSRNLRESPSFSIDDAVLVQANCSKASGMSKIKPSKLPKTLRSGTENCLSWANTKNSVLAFDKSINSMPKNFASEMKEGLNLQILSQCQKSQVNTDSDSGQAAAIVKIYLLMMSTIRT